MARRALVFAGQGAQSVGMGKDLSDAFPECVAVFQKADEVLGYSLSKLCFGGPIEELTKSSHCQPAIFAMSCACLAALTRTAGAVDMAGTAGLSLGEWTALHAAGAIRFEDGLRVLAARGRFMQEACDARAGGMVSVIGLSADALQGVCARTGVEIANLNSEEQTVLSGERGAIQEAEKAAQAAGAKKTVVLPVAGAFHSSLMQPAADKFRAFLADVVFSSPRVPVMANVTGAPHGGPEDIRRDMVAQVTSPVRWLSCVQWLRDHGVTEYIELGPGKVLSGLIKRIDRAAATQNVQDRPSLDGTAAALRG